MPKTVKILSIDGGGIRGLIPSLVLEEIERLTDKRIADMFDLVAGTSTGGILALGLTVADSRKRPKYRASDLTQMYEEEGGTIFSRSFWHRVTSLGSLTEAKYPEAGIEKVLKKYFGKTTLKEALTDVLITSYEIERRAPFLFKSHKARTDKTRNFPMEKVARATSAAPTYFRPLKLKARTGSDYFALVDGGVYANNPAMCAYVEALTLYPDADEYVLVSIGTGELTRSIPYDEAEDWGLAQWAQPILDVVFDGVSDTVNHQLKTVLGSNYYRFQVRLDEGSDSLDDCSRTNLRTLKLLAESIIRDNENELKTLRKKLLQPVKKAKKKTKKAAKKKVKKKVKKKAAGKKAKKKTSGR